LLKHIQQQFYPDNPKRFHRDRRMLLKAITWPATWLREKGLNETNVMPSDRYRQLILDQINEVKRYGQYMKYGEYFPGYLMKCIQNWFIHQGDGFYEQLKGARSLFDIALVKVQNLPAREVAQPPVVDVLAAAHGLVKKKPLNSTRNTTKNTQLQLL
jgi:hypothetical protein